MNRRLLVALTLGGALMGGCAGTMRAPADVTGRADASATTAAPTSPGAPVVSRQEAAPDHEPTPAEQHRALERAGMVVLGIVVVVAVVKLLL